MDCNLLGFSVHGILQASILEGLPFPSPEDLPDPGIESGSPALEADALTTEPRTIISVCESVSISWVNLLVSHFRFHIKVISYGICLSLLNYFT